MGSDKGDRPELTCRAGRCCLLKARAFLRYGQAAVAVRANAGFAEVAGRHENATGEVAR